MALRNRFASPLLPRKKSGEPQRRLAIRTEMLFDEALKRGRQLAAGKTKAAHDLALIRQEQKDVGKTESGGEP